MTGSPPSAGKPGPVAAEGLQRESGPPEWMTVEEVAAWLRVSRDSVYRWVRAGRLPALKVAGAIRVHRAEVLRYGGAAPVLADFAQRWRRTWARTHSPGTRCAIESAFRC